MALRVGGTDDEIAGWTRAARADGHGDDVRGWLRRQANIAAARAAPPGITIRQLCARFVAEYAGPNVRKLHEYRQDAEVRLRHVVDRVGDLDADVVTAAQLEDVRDAMRAAGKSAQTIVHVFNRLASAFKWARKRGIVRRLDVPARDVELPARPSGAAPVRPERFYTVQEARRLLLWLRRNTPQWHALFALLLWSGLRLGEARRLRWTDLDLRARSLWARDRKEGDTAQFPIAKALAAILEEHRRATGGVGLVFVAPRGGEHNKTTIRRALHRAAAGAGLRLIRPHDLRHSCASALDDDGVDLRVIAQILGHASTQTTRRYIHRGPRGLARLQEAVDRLDFVGPGLRVAKAVNPDRDRGFGSEGSNIS